LAAWWLGVVAGSAMLPRSAWPQSPSSQPPPGPAIFPLSEVRPGLVGEAVTVFEGVKPEPFKVRVLSVMPNFLPKQDIILIRAEDPRVANCGIAAGMSGSPVYVDGKLMGAIAYGWSFAKEAWPASPPSKACWRGNSAHAVRPAIHSCSTMALPSRLDRRTSPLPHQRLLTASRACSQRPCP
jgi:hypothetical protein